ncbi:hypothetical protein SAMN05443667_105261 [Flavobacterium gillisiae]|uniref:Lipoprotein n=1 Tax=Flavobacterium gillisiae TaxID=150146 RepID=A0A1H4C7J2_9FLAO|nr:hypothetical protein SAMN05443667_105261 [Flavobacterium gillisiae]
MKKLKSILGLFLFMAIVGCNEQKKTCICTTTYSGEGSEYYKDETLTIESYNGCSNEDTTVSDGELTIRLRCTEK